MTVPSVYLPWCVMRTRANDIREADLNLAGLTVLHENADWVPPYEHQHAVRKPLQPFKFCWHTRKHWCWRAVLCEPRSMLAFTSFTMRRHELASQSLCLTSRWDRTSAVRWDRCQVEHRVPGMNNILKSQMLWCSAKLVHFGREDNWCLETVGLDECWDYRLLCVWTVEERVNQMLIYREFSAWVAYYFSSQK